MIPTACSWSSRRGGSSSPRAANTTTFLDIEPIVHDLNPSGDYGLFSMAFSPDYATNHLFYVAYSGVDDPDYRG